MASTLPKSSRTTNPSRSNRASIVPVANPRGTQAQIDELKAEIARLRGSDSPQPLANPNERELLATIRGLEDENDELQDKLDKIADVATAPDDEDSLTDDDLKVKLNKVIDLATDGEFEDANDEDNDEDDSV